MTKKPNNLKQSDGLESISVGINTIMTQLTAMTATLDSHTGILGKFDEKCLQNQEAIVSLQNSNNLMMQSRLNERMEISGLPSLPVVPKSEFRALVWKSLHDMKIDVEKVEIADAYPYRRKIRSGDEKETIVVTFLHEAIKNRVMQSKMDLKTKTAKTVFFNDVLTPSNRTLIYQARLFKKAGKFDKVGTLNGKIYVRKDAKSKKIFVENVAEMEEIANLIHEE